MISNTSSTLTIAIPSFSRPLDLDFTINSIFESNVQPTEVLVIDDNSPDKDHIEDILIKWTEKFDEKKTIFRYLISDINNGYDINLQKLVE